MALSQNTIIGLLDTHTGTNAEVAAAINADPRYWSEISTDKVWAWLADAGRLYTLETFAGSIDPASDDAATYEVPSFYGVDE